MDLKKRKHFTPKKEDNPLESFLFFCVYLSSLVEFYNATLWRFCKLFESLSDGDQF